MTLTLGGAVSFKNGIISPNWFKTTNITISNLKIHLQNVRDLQQNAFNCLAFKYLKSLTLQHLTVKRLSAGVFNGLKSIKEIQFLNASIDEFENGILDGLEETLNIFTLICLPQRKAIAIDGITKYGLYGQHSLKNLTIRQNLSHTLRADTFLKIIALQQLNLSHCEIEIIERKTFDILGNDLEMLDLSGNKLKTLAGDVFDIVYHNQGSAMKVYIGDNPWHCDCDLTDFQTVLRNHNMGFRGRIQCETPHLYKATDVEDASLCEITPTSRTSSTQSLSNDYTVLQECNSIDGFLPVETIDIQCRSQLIQIVTSNGSIGLELQYVTSDLVVVWFDNRTVHQRSNNTGPNTANCVMPENRLVYFDNLMPDMVYTVCLMQKHSTLVSPLDCLSFSTIASGYEEPIWLTDHDKGVTIGLSVCGILFFLLFGVLIGYWTLRRFPIFLRHSKRIVVINNSLRKNEILVMPLEWVKVNENDRDDTCHEMDNK